MSSTKASTRFPWVALTLSFLSSGVGHIYCGRISKGLFLYSARFLLPLLCIAAAFLQPSSTVLVGLILLPALATVALHLYSAIDAFLIARRTNADYTLKDYNRSSLYWVLVAIQLAYPVALTWAAGEYIYEAFIIPTRSMSPNVLAGDRILVNKRPFRNDFPERGDLIVFNTPSSEKGRKWIKRVIGVSGDEVVIKGDRVEVNGKALQRAPVPKESLGSLQSIIEGDVYQESNAGGRYQILLSNRSTEDTKEAQEPTEIRVTVPDRSVFVLGDNRRLSRDSRHIGSIHIGDVIGYVEYNLLPAESWSRFGVCQN